MSGLKSKSLKNRQAPSTTTDILTGSDLLLIAMAIHSTNLILAVKS